MLTHNWHMSLEYMSLALGNLGIVDSQRYVGFIKTQHVFQQNQARGQEFIPNWCLGAYFTVKNFLSLQIITKIFITFFFFTMGKKQFAFAISAV